MPAMLRASHARPPDRDRPSPGPEPGRAPGIEVVSTSTDASICRSCGACCAFSRDWPRFTTETDAEIDCIAGTFVDDGLDRMRCDGDRCAALVGEVGASTTCAVYAVRPDVCRACEPGDEACGIARHKFGLVPLAAPE